MKIRIYRVLGWLFIALGIVTCLSMLLTPGRYQAFMNNPVKHLLPTVYGTLMVLVLNVFIWTGFILHWRADRNEDPEVRSKWGRCMKLYASFAALMLIFTAVLFFSAHWS